MQHLSYWSDQTSPNPKEGFRRHQTLAVRVWFGRLSDLGFSAHSVVGRRGFKPKWV